MSFSRVRRLLLLALFFVFVGGARGAEGVHVPVEGRYSLKIDEGAEPSPPIDDRILVMTEKPVTVEECVRVYRRCWFDSWVRVCHTINEKSYNLINRSEYAALFGNDPTAQIVSTPAAPATPPVIDSTGAVRLTDKQLARQYARIAALRNYVDSLRNAEATADQHRIIAHFNLFPAMAAVLGEYVYADEVVSEAMDMGSYVIEIEAQINTVAVEELVRTATEAGAEEIRAGSLALLVAGREVGAMRVRLPSVASQTIENKQITEIVAFDPATGKALNTTNTNTAVTDTEEEQHFEKEYKFRPSDISAANSLLINQLTDADLEVLSNSDIIDVLSEMTAAGDFDEEQTEQSAIKRLSTVYAMQDSPEEWMTPLHRAMKELECTYYGFALLDVGQEITDPITGNAHVEVALYLNVLRRDERGRRVRYINFAGTDSVINGTGANHLSAKNDGIRKAAKAAGDILADKIRQQAAIQQDRK